ncbi:two-component hybrid sensor and regulator [Calothrix sp. NIES-4071]|nr:two-component hybrid sensor and regulator [Calothrix sp. NIES-4071]BAZ58028.1 two-component hybrid sensor and regulator [Calothrix sp. NIES-4105]
MLHVLVIDDNKADRALVIRELKREFATIEIQEIVDASELAAALTAKQFNVVITDYELRWTTGLDILRTVKQLYPYCPVIMFTGTGSEEVAVEAMKSGLDDYVLKSQAKYAKLPFTVRAAVKRASNRRSSELLEIRLRKLLNQLQVGTFRADSNGNYIESNAVFLNLLGIDNLAQLQNRDILNIREYYLVLENLPEPQQDLEIQLQRPDSTFIWVTLSITLNEIDGQNVLDGLIEDITARKQVEIERQQLNLILEQRVQERTAELEATNRALDEINQKLVAANQDLETFSYSVSHDLRSPLRTIQGFGTILLRQELEPERQQEYLQRIIINAESATRLVDDLLAYSRLSRSELPLRLIDLSSVVAEVLIQLEPIIKQRQATVQVEEPLPDVIGNYTVLNQVISNIVSNALKFVAPEVKPVVRIRAESIYNKIRLWIEDNGIGIADKYQERIFSVFTRLHSDEEYPGTGIGLAIVRKGAERLNAEVGIESQPGQGSRFWIELNNE